MNMDSIKAILVVPGTETAAKGFRIDEKAVVFLSSPEKITVVTALLQPAMVCFGTTCAMAPNTTSATRWQESVRAPQAPGTFGLTKVPSGAKLSMAR